MTAVGFEPTQLALVELESTPLDHSGKLSTHILEAPSNKNWLKDASHGMTKAGVFRLGFKGLACYKER